MTSVATKRQVLNIPAVSHGATPIPLGVKIGNRIFSSGIEPVDPETGKLGTTPERQVELTFRHMRTLREAGGATLDNVGLVTVYLQDIKYRPIFERYWQETFSD